MIALGYVTTLSAQQFNVRCIANGWPFASDSLDEVVRHCRDPGLTKHPLLLSVTYSPPSTRNADVIGSKLACRCRVHRVA
jgi:hypothetical protein